jgi:hypothetical protein
VASHEILGGLVQVCKRGAGRYWQCFQTIRLGLGSISVRHETAIIIGVALLAALCFVLGREPINSDWSADVRLGAHSGLISDITVRSEMGQDWTLETVEVDTDSAVTQSRR